MNQSTAVNYCSHYSEILSVMICKEQTTVYRSCDYLHDDPELSSVWAIASSPRVVDDMVRTELVDWCYIVIDKCQFERETVAVAMDMVDRFLSKPSDSSILMLQSRSQFQLLTMTALYIAIKTQEKSTIVLGSDFFSAISQDLYTVQEIEAMELILLKGLS
jgi:hypothetical protein